MEEKERRDIYLSEGEGDAVNEVCFRGTYKTSLSEIYWKCGRLGPLSITLFRGIVVPLLYLNILHNEGNHIKICANSCIIIV